MPEIKNGETIIANGSILEDGKIRYRFTDYINNREHKNKLIFKFIY
ncbi:hypothetical protein J4710_10055 [Staphylococcus xylosus]|uniref:SDR-like Ig domain-containing protein n=1 Tax=Staphylococcus xylosus TaxID=1288 RepID=A0A939NM05_STAXY|nr:hypothetical protein [Staphylococcus xylosus]